MVQEKMSKNVQNNNEMAWKTLNIEGTNLDVLHVCGNLRKLICFTHEPLMGNMTSDHGL